TIYHYWKNKEEILFECVRTGLTMLEVAVDEAARSEGGARDRLLQAMRRYVETVMLEFGRCVVSVGEQPLSEGRRLKLRRHKSRINQTFCDLLSAGIAEQSIAPCDVRVTSFALANVLGWIGTRPRAGDDDVPSPHEIAEKCVAILMGGLDRRL